MPHDYVSLPCIDIEGDMIAFWVIKNNQLLAVFVLHTLAQITRN